MMPRSTIRSPRTVALVALVAVSFAVTTAADDPARNGAIGHDHAGDDRATVHHRFDDAERWSKVFDDPARDGWQRPAAVVAALGLEAGDTVADLGAGTGYFLPYLSDAVGPRGTVLAVEVEPNLVEHMAARARDEGLEPVRTVLAAADDPRLPTDAVDAVLLVDTYHHIDRRVDYFGRLRAAMTPSGRLVVVDFDPDAPDGPGPSRHHRIAADDVVAELDAAGWTLLRRDDDLLEYQYLLVFGFAE